MSSADVNSLCRLCLAKCSGDSFNIFEDSSNLPVRIMACCSLEIQKTDALPKQICANCRYQLHKTYIFRIKSRNSEAKLKRHIRMKTSGKACNVIDEEEEVDEYADSLEYVQAYERSEESKKLKDLQAMITKIKQNEQKLHSELENMKALYETQRVELETQKVSKTDSEDQDTEYYIEMLDDDDTKYRPKASEPMEIEVEEEEDKGDLIRTHDNLEQLSDDTPAIRYECEPEEYSAIEKAVRATLLAQQNCTVQTNFQMRLDKIGQNLTKAEVTTDDGNILFMEFNTETNSEGNRTYSKKVYTCVECKISFSTSSKYKRHLYQHNRDVHEKGLLCKFCTTWWPTKTALERHERTHTGERPFKCETCNKYFVQKEVLKRHQLSHTGEKPFACTLGCTNESFKTREQLRSHNNRCHVLNPTPEIHKCQHCPKFFCHSSGLSRHMLQHAGKTFDCKICLKTYTDASTLRRHMISVHASRPQNVKQKL